MCIFILGSEQTCHIMSSNNINSVGSAIFWVFRFGPFLPVRTASMECSGSLDKPPTPLPEFTPLPWERRVFFFVSAAPADPGAVRVGFVGDPNVEGILGDAILAGGQPRHALTSSLGTPIFMDGSCEHTSKILG